MQNRGSRRSEQPVENFRVPRTGYSCRGRSCGRAVPRHRGCNGRRSPCECAPINPCLRERECGINPGVVLYSYRKTLYPGLSAHKSRQLSCSRTNKEGRTALDACLKQIYPRTRILAGVVPVRLLILFNATEPLAHKPCQSRPQPRGWWKKGAVLTQRGGIQTPFDRMTLQDR